MAQCLAAADIFTTASYCSRASIVVPTTLFLLVLSLTRNLRSLPDRARAGRANPIIPGRNAVSTVRRFMCLSPSLGMQCYIHLPPGRAELKGQPAQQPG